MSTALLIIDLEGIRPVERLEQILAGSPSYPRAQRWLTDEVNFVVEALRRAHGFDRVVVSDSHLSGSGKPSVLELDLVPGAELSMLDDAYDARLFAGAEAVACLGMHAGAGPEGFIPHTANLHCAWSLEGQNLTETDLVVGLAAEAGAPVLFATGDDVLERQLGGRIGFVRTKIACSTLRARPLPRKLVFRALAEAAARPIGPPTPMHARRLDLAFHSVWQADLAEDAGAERTGARSVRVTGESFRELYERATAVADRPGERLGDALRGRPGTQAFHDDVAALLSRRSLVADKPSASRSRLGAIAQSFWRQTASGSEDHRALRALVLHMLEHHAPGVFAELDLAPRLARALADLSEIPATLEPDLSFDVAQARVDACFVRAERGAIGPVLDQAELAALVTQYLDQGDTIQAFVLGEMAALVGTDARALFRERPYRDHDRTEDLYWLTHLYLVASRYLSRPVERALFGCHTEELILAVPWVLETGQVDLAAEIALCMQLVGEHEASEHHALLAFLDRHTRSDGLVRDPSAEEYWLEMADHATGATLLALAGVRRVGGQYQQDRWAKASHSK